MRYTLAFIAALLTSSQALADNAPRCEDRDTLLEHLQQKYGEVPTAAGIAENGALITVLQSPNGATWSLLVISPDGRACPLAGGSSWIDKKAPTETEANKGPGL